MRIGHETLPQNQDSECPEGSSRTVYLPIREECSLQSIGIGGGYHALVHAVNPIPMQKMKGQAANTIWEKHSSTFSGNAVPVCRSLRHAFHNIRPIVEKTRVHHLCKSKGFLLYSDLRLDTFSMPIN